MKPKSGEVTTVTYSPNESYKRDGTETKLGLPEIPRVSQNFSKNSVKAS